MALPSLWYVRDRPGNALDNAGLPRCTHPDNNSASRLFKQQFVTPARFADRGMPGHCLGTRSQTESECSKQKLKLELLRGSRPKLESLPISVVVHEHLVRAGRMFFGTITRRTLTRLHRPTAQVGQETRAESTTDGWGESVKLAWWKVTVLLHARAVKLAWWKVIWFDLIYWICRKAGTLYKTVQNSMLYMRWQKVTWMWGRALSRGRMVRESIVVPSLK